MQSSYQGFVLRGAHIDAAESKLSLRDYSFGNSEWRMNLPVNKTYISEFDTTVATGRTPRGFAKEYGRGLRDYFMLRDPNGNEIEVQIERRSNKLFFKHGWYGLKDFYDIDLGGWVVFTYERPDLMFMSIYNRMDVEIAYPKFNEPIIARLDRKLCETGSVELSKEESLTLKASDVHCGYLVVPWTGFYEQSLPHFETDITVVDYVGFYWKCVTRFEEKNNTLQCIIGGEWETMCRSRNFAVGQILKVAVEHESNNNVIYLRFVSGQYKQPAILTPMTKVISKKTGEALYSIEGTYINVEVARVSNDMLKLNSYFVEFEPYTDKVRMPSCFSKEYGIYIDDVVMLCDPNKNMTEVRVDKKKGKVYLRDGWLNMKNFYALELGAWIKLTYVGPNMFLMDIRKKSGVEINYPNIKPPVIRRILNPQRTLTLQRFHCSSVHILTSADIESGVLVLSWCEFVRHALSENYKVITIVDRSKFRWKCTMQFTEEANRMLCKIGGEWRAICRMRSFRVGHAIKLGVCRESGTDVVFLRHVPLECTHAYYIRPPRPDVTEKFVYEVNHYFLRCPANKETA